MIALRIVSIVGLIWYLFVYTGFFVDNLNMQTSIGLLFMGFGYAIAHAIVSILQGQKHKIKLMVVLSIIGFALYELFTLILAANPQPATAAGAYVFAGGYAFLFAIVTIIISCVYPKKEQVEMPPQNEVPPQIEPQQQADNADS